MNLAERIKEQLAQKGWTPTELARRAGMKQPTVHRILSGVTADPKMGTIERIAKALGVDPIWLSTGKSGSRPESNAILMDAEVSDHPGEPGLYDVDLPFFEEVELAAGSGKYSVIENSSNSLRFSIETLAQAGVSSGNAACAKVSGDSMEPLIPNGTTIAIDKGFKKIIDGEIYAINHDGMLRVKKLYRLPMNRIRVVSENDVEFPEEILSSQELEHFSIIGRVFWWEVVRRPRLF